MRNYKYFLLILFLLFTASFVLAQKPSIQEARKMAFQAAQKARKEKRKKIQEVQRRTNETAKSSISKKSYSPQSTISFSGQLDTIKKFIANEKYENAVVYIETLYHDYSNDLTRTHPDYYKIKSFQYDVYLKTFLNGFNLAFEEVKFFEKELNLLDEHAYCEAVEYMCFFYLLNKRELAIESTELIPHLKRAIDLIDNESEDKELLLDLLQCLVSIYDLDFENKNSELLETCDKGIKILEDDNELDRDKLRLFYSSKASAYEKLRQMRNALVYEEKSMEIYLKKKTNTDIIYIAKKISLARKYENLKLYQQAIDIYSHLMDCYRDTKHENHRAFLSRYLSRLSRLNESIGNYQLAYNYQLYLR